MINYVKISTTGNISGGKFYDVLEMASPIPYLDTPVTSEKTLGGGSFYSTGIGKKNWEFVIGFYYSDSRSGYGTMTDVLAIINATTTTALTLKFNDWLSSSTVYDVYMMNRGSTGILEPVTATIDAANSYYKFNIELRQV